jgi:hypothetical protein
LNLKTRLAGLYAHGNGCGNECAIQQTRFNGDGGRRKSCAQVIRPDHGNTILSWEPQPAIPGLYAGETQTAIAFRIAQGIGFAESDRCNLRDLSYKRLVG